MIERSINLFYTLASSLYKTNQMKFLNVLIQLPKLLAFRLPKKGKSSGVVFGLFLALLMTQTGWAQEKDIQGIVTDSENNQPLPGASVILKGTSKGVVTDFDGNYSIKVPSEKSVLTVSYVGFQPQEIVVGSNTTINVVLLPNMEALDEVVVVGFGTQKKLIYPVP